MVDRRILEGVLKSQSIALTTTRRIQTVLIDTASLIVQDEDNKEQETARGGSRPGRHPNLAQGFEEGYQQLLRDYLELLLRIVNEVTQHNPYFEQRRNAAGVFGLYPVQKIMSAIRMLAYGDAVITARSPP
ncbi:hypothetical protein PCASD_00801 [Puccinia coronata f. sp. avenae]|uniref:Uncharacterized protein n=1 Tax=Puccinia coronata f. sp. avenae TaxID=200324 RepID=A0A2N5VPD9_9BASI|nr:hypothetical protein PCASD_00801 [Puccinia coronata f. sp. avenae]